MHPRINALTCIGCGNCVEACPEGDVLGVVNGTAILLDGAKCVGHGRCADACPVEGITMVMAPPGRNAELPLLSSDLETTMPGIFIVGELGGLGLIRNAVTQGTAAVRTLASRPRPESEHAFDVIIVGAGPAGLASALAAQESGLRYLLLEQDSIGGSILHYPRRKIVLTAPFELPLWGKVRFTEVSKEQLLSLWLKIIAETNMNIRTNEKVTHVERHGDGYMVHTKGCAHSSRNVVLAMGRRGTPRKLGVPGEDQGKVMYRLIDAESFQGANILVVGGGDSAVEAAVGLSLRGRNRVTLSYRGEQLHRVKERNRSAISEAVRHGMVRALYNSTVKEIHPEQVVLTTHEGERILENDLVFVFAGGEMPFGFLRAIGVTCRDQAA